MGRNLRDAASDQPGDVVDEVTGVHDQHTPTRSFAVRPPVAAGAARETRGPVLGAPVLAEHDTCAKRVAEHTGIDQPSRCLNARIEALAVAHGDPHAVLDRGRDHAVTVLNAGRHGLLDDDVFPGLSGGDGQFRVQMMWRADHHRVHVAVGEQSLDLTRVSRFCCRSQATREFEVRIGRVGDFAAASSPQRSSILDCDLAAPDEAKAQPPPELRLAWQAISYHALPEVGGLFDQPAGLLSRITQAYNVWIAFKRYCQRDVNKHKEWVEANPDLYETILRVNKLRESQQSHA